MRSLLTVALSLVLGISFSFVRTSKAEVQPAETPAVIEPPSIKSAKNNDKTAKEAEEQPQKVWPAALDFTMQTLEGKKVHLGKRYEGRVVLLVNVASRCGFTPQYQGLQSLHKKYTKQGLSVVGVPCNQFGGQEPGSSTAIAQFCNRNYGVKFDMLAKVNVLRNKKKQSPLYHYLTDKKKLPKWGTNIKWNFEKFLINRQGQVVGHYRSRVAPESKQLIQVIEVALAEEFKEVKKAEEADLAPQEKQEQQEDCKV